MADNKHALIRYQALDRCFRNTGRRFFINDLLDAVNETLSEIHPDCTGIQIRQLRDDIRFMKSEAGYSAPIESFTENRKAYYRYADNNFSITNQPLSEKEAQQLKEAMQTLQRFKGLPQFEWLEETMVRLDQTFHFKEERKIIEFEENIYLKGREHLDQLYSAISNCITLSIDYKPFKSPKINTCCSPYYLKEYNNRWFLFAFCHVENKLMNMPLDRIKSICNSNAEFIPNIEFDFEEYFEDVIGVTIYAGEQAQKITIKIDAQLWPYIQTKPIHGSQKEIEINESYTIITLELIPNFELEARILSFGEHIQVLSPKAFKDILTQRISKLNKTYSD